LHRSIDDGEQEKNLLKELKNIDQLIKNTEKEEKKLQKLIRNEKSRQDALKQQENIEIQKK
jgi:hypothetical protein